MPEHDEKKGAAPVAPIGPIQGVETTQVDDCIIDPRDFPDLENMAQMLEALESSIPPGSKYPLSSARRDSELLRNYIRKQLDAGILSDEEETEILKAGDGLEISETDRASSALQFLLNLDMKRTLCQLHPELKEEVDELWSSRTRE